MTAFVIVNPCNIQRGFTENLLDTNLRGEPEVRLRKKVSVRAVAVIVF